MFPAINIDASGTRKEERLMPPSELALVWRLRRVLTALDPGAALELLIDKIRATKSNEAVPARDREGGLSPDGWLGRRPGDGELIETVGDGWKPVALREERDGTGTALRRRHGGEGRGAEGISKRPSWRFHRYVEA